MSRWEPNTRDRLAQAALELYGERGYDQTTVADIAQRAGLTERTYFRYFVDKREVLFWGEDVLHDVFVNAVTDAPNGVAPLDAVAAGLDAVGEMFVDRHGHSRRRQAVIAANAALQERELIKLESLSRGISDGLRARGVPDLTAHLAAETGIGVFKVAFAQWVADPDQSDLRLIIRDVFAQMRSLAARR